MSIDAILDGLKDKSISFDAAEAIILEILEFHIKSQKKDFKTQFRMNNSKSWPYRAFDGFAPLGFDNFIGATAIEIKLYRNKSSLKNNLNEILKMFISLNPENDFNIENLLIIVAMPLSKDEILHLESLYENLPFKYFIWSNHELQELLNKYPQLITDIETNPSKALVNQVIKIGLNSSKDEWKIKRDEHLHNLKKSFIEDDVVLFLGAGASFDAKIATWNDLISNLMVSLLNTKIKDDRFDGHVELSETEKKALVKSIQEKNGNSPLQLVRFIRNGLGDLFREELRKILYKECVDTSRTLEAITDLSVPLRHGVGLQGIVTYNFDDLLEVNFTNKKVIKFRPIFREADLPSKNELGIYHVHGFLPRNPTEYDGLENKKKEQESLLVFSEEEYHQLMLDSYHWANLVQLNFFKERTCLFIGTSMTDPNVRRLLEIAKQKQPEQNDCKHYIILVRDTFSKIQNQDGIDNENIIKFAMVHQKLKEADLSELGLNVIWIDKHEEIPYLLDRLRKE
nr:SIR2 family protein [uncultured Lysinibacillus sp.]